MNKAAVLTHILKSEVKASLLGGEPPIRVINSEKYIPALTAGGPDESWPCLDRVIQSALSSQIRSVVLVGPEGSGKTTALQKLVLDWAEGGCLQNFSHVFHLQFRDMDSLEGELLLEALIQRGRHLICPGSMLLVTEKPDDVLFVLDGLDEYNHSLDPSVHTLCSDPSQAVSASCLVASLLHGSLLRGAAFLVATRPTENVKFLRGTRVEALGFLKPQREAFFNGFFTEPSAADKVFLHLERTLGFYDFCSSPRFCWTVCSIYKSLMDSGGSLPETLSQLFVDILVHLIQKTSQSEAWNREFMLALGRMASHCFIDQHSRCTKDQMDSFGFQPFLYSVDHFLRVDGELRSDSCFFSFHSQLMQEFVLAVAFFLDRSQHRGTERMLDEHKGAAKFLDLFLSGLSEPLQHKSLVILLGEFNPDPIQDFRSWFKRSSQEMLAEHYKEKHYRCFRLLHQAQNKSLVKEVVRPPAHPCIYHTNPSLQDCVALNFVITCLGQREKLSLSQATLTGEMVEVLSPAMSLSHAVILSGNFWQTEAASRLASAVSAGVTRELNLSRSNLGDETLRVLCAGLKDGKLHSLNLSACSLTAACCDDLVSVLTSQTSLLHILEVMYNQIGDQGLTKLCRAMHSPLCGLQELQLQNCDLTAASMEALAAALCSARSQLRKVNLTNNLIGDSGAEALCKALQQPLCKLQSLILFDCGLTDACCFHLKEALMSEHSSLSELDVSLNDLGQEGALLLCQGLRRPGCPIQRLGLTRCELTQAVFEELGSLLKNGACQIKSLLLGLNKVGNTGVKHLWDALAHPSCLLEELNLEMTDLTNECVDALCAAVRTSKTLKLLEMRNNLLTDASVPAIVQVMRDKRSMEELNLRYNDFSEEVFDMLEECDNIRY